LFEIDVLKPSHGERCPQLPSGQFNNKMMHAKADTLFIVEDDPSLRETLTEILAETGYRITAVSNGMDAFLQLAQRAPGDLPAVILLDLMMPVMNGWEFRRLMLQDLVWSTIPVIVTTALPLPECKLSQLDAVAVMTKPYDIRTLLRHLAPYRHLPNPAPPRVDRPTEDETEHFLCSVAEAFALADAGLVDAGHQLLLEGAVEAKGDGRALSLQGLWADALRRFRERFGVRLH
jgi:CheY-like chemotaxis protein